MADKKIDEKELQNQLLELEKSKREAFLQEYEELVRKHGFQLDPVITFSGSNGMTASFNIVKI